MILPRLEYVDLAHLSQIRRIVDESGILSREEFDEVLVEEIVRRFDNEEGAQEGLRKTAREQKTDCVLTSANTLSFARFQFRGYLKSAIIRI